MIFGENLNVGGKDLLGGDLRSPSPFLVYLCNLITHEPTLCLSFMFKSLIKLPIDVSRLWKSLHTKQTQTKSTIYTMSASNQGNYISSRTFTNVSEAHSNRCCLLTAWCLVSRFSSEETLTLQIIRVESPAATSFWEAETLWLRTCLSSVVVSCHVMDTWGDRHMRGLLCWRVIRTGKWSGGGGSAWQQKRTRPGRKLSPTHTPTWPVWQTRERLLYAVSWNVTRLVGRTNEGRTNHILLLWKEKKPSAGCGTGLPGDQSHVTLSAGLLLSLM